PLAQRRYGRRELGAARGGLSQPERHARRLPASILDAHLAALHSQNAIGTVAELKDIAREAFYRKVLVERADEGAGRLEYHAIIGRVGNRPTAGQRREPRAA